MLYRNIHDELSKKLSNLVRALESTNENVKVKLVEVKELWAWNNDESLISMQKHCFKHRQSEDMINFDVSNVILGIVLSDISNLLLIGTLIQEAETFSVVLGSRKNYVGNSCKLAAKARKTLSETVLEISKLTLT